MNSQQHSVTKKAPYDIVFGQRMRSDRVAFYERNSRDILQEDIGNDNPGAEIAVLIDPEIVRNEQFNDERQRSRTIISRDCGALEHKNGTR
jgi:hypothetical protein